MSGQSDDHLYSLVAQEVVAALEGSNVHDLSRLRDEIAWRLDNDELSFETQFMTSVLERISDIVSGIPPRAPVLKFKPSIAEISGSGIVADKDLELLGNEERLGMGEGEELFTSEGHDFNSAETSKYISKSGVTHPRVPRFYNLVRKGVVWNKYAQTHYDEKNPPPKQVLGYKFNIFYPDQIDPSKKPVYKLETCHTSPEHLLLRFIGNPPYEDLVFKIVNKEWDIDRKYGFVSNFENGVLRLHFKLRKERYRR